jgi:hypothetical protein
MRNGLERALKRSLGVSKRIRKGQWKRTLVILIGGCRTGSLRVPLGDPAASHGGGILPESTGRGSDGAGNWDCFEWYWGT